MRSDAMQCNDDDDVWEIIIQVDGKNNKYISIYIIWKCIENLLHTSSFYLTPKVAIAIASQTAS